MTAPVWTIGPDTLTIEALQFAEEHGIHHLPVLEFGEPIGLVCTCALQSIGLNAPVRAALSRSAVTVREDASLCEALELMLSEQVGSVLVTGNAGVVGILTRGDVSDSWPPEANESSGQSCLSCRAIQHLATDTFGITLCSDCRSKAEPANADDEIGGG